MTDKELLDELAAKFGDDTTAKTIIEMAKGLNNEAPELWTVKEIADWLRLSYRHVAERVIHRKGFPKPINGARRWPANEVIEWSMQR